MNGMSWLLLLPVIVALALFVGYFAQKLATARKLGDAESRAQRILDDAKRLVDQASRESESKIREAEAKVRAGELEAKELVLKVRTELDQEGRARQKEIQGVERRILQQEEQLARRLDQLDRRETDAQNRERAMTERERVMTESRREAQLMGMRLEEEARETAHAKAKEVLATTIQRLAPDYTVETAVSVVDLPSDDMKGRIIGREGRNIRALELHTGVDLIVDDTPEAVLISAYDPYRREIARQALQILIADGRIHPARIEEVVEKVKREMEQHLKEEGEKACFEVGVHGLHPELTKLVGRMKFRTSYGQNCLQHSKEVAWLAGMMAAEIKADVKLAKRMGLLHDIGKALTHEQEGSHPELSLQVLSKYGESPQIINAALCGHENVEPETIEAVLTEAADGISAARPGARRDVLESYIKRLAKLEEIAMSYKGVEMCYAIQAGRELRVMTKAEQISDLDAHQLAKDISKRIEAEMQYPGHIKVIVIRETRAVEVAK